MNPLNQKQFLGVVPVTFLLTYIQSCSFIEPAQLCREVARTQKCLFYNMTGFNAIQFELFILESACTQFSQVSTVLTNSGKNSDSTY